MMRILPQAAQRLLHPVVIAEFFAVSNLGFLAMDILVAHSMNRFAHWAEWIPFVFSLVAPAVLISAMFIAGEVRPPLQRPNETLTAAQRLSRGLGMLVGVFSIVVGVAGLLWHLESQFFEEQTLKNLVYAAPFVAPLAYSGIGLLILLNRMVPSETDEWARWVILLALGGWVGNFALSLTDHAQNSFFYWPEWIPVIASALAVGALSVAFVDYRNGVFLRVCVVLMAGQIVVGVAGWILHGIAVVESPMDRFWDRIVYSAPVFAPLLFADLAVLALIGLGTLAARSNNAVLFSASAVAEIE